MTFGSGGFVCSFSEKELSEFHQHLEKSFNFDDPMHVKKGLICAGKQPDSDIWVLNKELHINEDGVQVPPRESKYAWQPLGGPCIDLPGKSASQTIDLQCDICLPLQSRVPLQNLLHAMRSVFKHNFISSKCKFYCKLLYDFTHYCPHNLTLLFHCTCVQVSSLSQLL